VLLKVGFSLQWIVLFPILWFFDWIQPKGVHAGYIEYVRCCFLSMGWLDITLIVVFMLVVFYTILI